MTEPLKCPTCAAELPPGTPLGSCPRCLFGLGLETEKTAAPKRPPHRFASYDLIRQLGCGGMGVVYEARQPGLSRTVALKMILGAETCSPILRRRFHIEAEAAARLDHPNIVPIYEVGEYEDQPFISMKLVRGKSLRDKMKHGEFGPVSNAPGPAAPARPEAQRKSASLVATMARAVHHAHAHNVVHRDLKPGNILFDAEGVPHLADFGLAKILEPDQAGPSAPSQILGTLTYMSPEQVRAGRITPATDIYSLGVILYELLSGHPPFHGSTPNETLRLIENQPATRLRSRDCHFDRDLETVCLKCLEKEPGSRYGSAEALAEDLESWLRHEPIKARPAGPVRRLGRWIKRNPVGTALIASLVVALLALTGFVFLLIQRIQQDREHNATIVAMWARKIDDIWRDPNYSSVLIPAEDLANLRGLRPPESASAQRLTFALNITENAVAQARAFAPLLDQLQKRMETFAGQRVIFDLKLCKMSQFSFREIVEGKADFQRLGAVSYLRARQLNPSVQAMVQEPVGKPAVIMVRTDSPITNLSQFFGKCLALGDSNSTIAAWAKVYLIQAGVRGTNLVCKTFDDTTHALGNPRPRPLNSSAGELELPADIGARQAIQEVLERRCDGAALQRLFFDRHAFKGLREVHTFAITPNVYVANITNEQARVFATAFQQAMLAIDDLKLLRKIPSIQQPAERFQPFKAAEFDQLQDYLTNEVMEFERVSPQPPKRNE
jgi:serine/threonine protein kinase